MGQGVRERLIAGTVQLLARKGVAGTGIAEVIDTSKVSRRSIYLTFPGGKSELVTEATRSAGTTISRLVQHLSTQEGDRSPVTTFAEIWRVVLQESDFSSGCPIVAAALGRQEAPEAADAAGAAFADWTGILSTRFRNAGLAEAAATSLAATVVAAIEGAVIMCLAARSIDPLDRVSQELADLIDLRLAGTTREVPTGA